MDHQNLSEHVLCMVLYLIELGLENSAEDDSEEEVSTASVLEHLRGSNLCLPSGSSFQEV